MKLQFLGDSRDSFKWDYHNYLTESLGYPLLNIFFMMTPDEDTKQGNTNPKQFPARQEVIDFCKYLKNERDKYELSKKFKQGQCDEVSTELQKMISQLPERTAAKYSVDLHQGAHLFINNKDKRNAYFSNIRKDDKQVLFIDPDNGFEPKRNPSDKHLLYHDIGLILNQVSNQSVISVFQYFRLFHSAQSLFKIINQRINGLKQNKLYTIAIYKHPVMFIIISKSEDIIDKVRTINENYSVAVTSVIS
ncbi:MAG: hypothetical protein ABSC11_10370 [Smithella sp.]|jgi:hypothetical protein